MKDDELTFVKYSDWVCPLLSSVAGNDDQDPGNRISQSNALTRDEEKKGCKGAVRGGSHGATDQCREADHQLSSRQPTFLVGLDQIFNSILYAILLFFAFYFTGSRNALLPSNPEWRPQFRKS